MKTARERTVEYYAQVDTLDDMDAVRALAAKFNAYYAALEGAEREAANQVIHERVMEQGRRIDEAIARMEAATAPLAAAASEK